MATPKNEDGSDKELKLNLDEPVLNWGEISIFAPDPDEVDQQQLFFKLRYFMIKRGNWSRKEVDQLTNEDSAEIIEAVRGAITEKSVPKASGSTSESGPTES